MSPHSVANMFGGVAVIFVSFLYVELWLKLQIVFSFIIPMCLMIEIPSLYLTEE